MNLLKQLQDWYRSNCDGEWEHIYGVSIETLDNPGWLLKIDLAETRLEDRDFEDIEVESTEEDWMSCRVADKKFIAAGDATKLEVILTTFVNWAKTDESWLDGPVYETDEDQNRTFLKSLPRDVPGEKCMVDGCESDRIENSVLCRQHHFEKYKSSSI